MNETAWQGDLEQTISGYARGQTELQWHGYDLCVFKQSWGELVIALQGGQVLLFRPAGEQPLLWLTDQPAAGGAIRGGVPLCWPWFAEPIDDASLPKHGVARTARWTLECVSMNAEGGCWRLLPPPSLWHGLTLALEVTVEAGALSLALTSHNLTAQPIAMTQALHSYFAVSDSAQVELQGLDGLPVRDKLQGMQARLHHGAVMFPEATDVIFGHDSETAVRLIDHGWQRVIGIQKQGSRSTVVWNPGAAAAEIGDVGIDQVSRFVCVEAACTRFYDRPWIDAGETQTLTTSFRVLPYSR
ncbi:D-hexose-6-phosphate mutarotase [Amphritea sp. 1_MG-2023]|uniref:D-hexose-6-phosphate mutarotase n=1 Tax=Amphritea sp. 1_MG-2023 TaxID=3062670 RepID=UPI0026E3BCFA|nr:D-hexose-6-phosphate mutarotase [Amphritea sp. 1_MG-2023]MDO6563320.1 D-hexose-6-phosphate mutarotase [Amphritea sp. 1_MG-2023]